MDVPFGVGPS